MESGVFALYYTEGQGWHVEMRPIWIPWSRLGPQYVTGDRRTKILARFKQLCKELGTRVIIQKGQALIPAPPLRENAWRLPAASNIMVLQQGA